MNSPGILEGLMQGASLARRHGRQVSILRWSHRARLAQHLHLHHSRQSSKASITTLKRPILDRPRPASQPGNHRLIASPPILFKIIDQHDINLPFSFSPPLISQTKTTIAALRPPSPDPYPNLDRPPRLNMIDPGSEGRWSTYHPRCS